MEIYTNKQFRRRILTNYLLCIDFVPLDDHVELLIEYLSLHLYDIKPKKENDYPVYFRYVLSEIQKYNLAVSKDYVDL